MNYILRRKIINMKMNSNIEIRRKIISKINSSKKNKHFITRRKNRKIKAEIKMINKINIRHSSIFIIKEIIITTTIAATSLRMMELLMLLKLITNEKLR